MAPVALIAAVISVQSCPAVLALLVWFRVLRKINSVTSLGSKEDSDLFI